MPFRFDPEKKPTKSLSVTLPLELINAVELVAKENEATKSRVVEQMLEYALEDQAQ